MGNATIHKRAGKAPLQSSLINVEKLEKQYFGLKPDPSNPQHAVSFGTSGHRGTSADRTFNEDHILAITQAICEERAKKKIYGPLFMGKDTHALSDAAQRTALEVLAANGVEVVIQEKDGYTPTPVISHAILTWNRKKSNARADGIVITPSHNPPADGGFKYNPPDGGPAGSDVTKAIQDRANELLAAGNVDVRRVAYRTALRSGTTRKQSYVTDFVEDLGAVIDMNAIRKSKVRIGVDPLGGAAVAYWKPIAERYGLDIKVVNKKVDPQFGFMTLDHDGKIRMDCSSPWAMASLVTLKDDFDIAWGNDPDADRHGIVTRSSGLLNPNHYLAVAIDYLLTHRPKWSDSLAVGKTIVSSTMIDRVVAGRGRKLLETPVGFKWFAPGLFDQSVCFGGEESAGASFLRRDGKVWTTDKDGIILGLLAAEITAVTGRDPGEHYRDLTERYGQFFYTRIDNDCSPEQKAAFSKLVPDAVKAKRLAGDPISQKMIQVPGTGAAIGGLKVISEGGWFAARPSGTEAKYKLYAESYRSAEHLNAIVAEAAEIVTQSLKA